ncbi:hypothetical protein BDA96_07G096500 [Sorghum bicolor]|uniref:Uncharacterized protein n=1 Tax=Sorghum bicolor TaxID=4558 RepID=A0A921QLK3_SORBI|nr:hypothetical protein BDA96_07G096500 [Sorghum bicolor]
MIESADHIHHIPRTPPSCWRNTTVALSERRRLLLLCRQLEAVACLRLAVEIWMTAASLWFVTRCRAAGRGDTSAPPNSVLSPCVHRHCEYPEVRYPP